MDQDGVNEYMIQSPDKDCIVLHYYGGKVYSYGFDINNFYNLNTDGTFYWSDSSSAANWKGGLNKIIFEEETLTIKTIYSIQYLAYGVDAYYMGEESVTRDEFLSYYNSNHKTRMSFSPFEWTCSYPITAEQAWNIANTYWNNADCREEGAAGTTLISKVVLLDTPDSDTNHYRFALQVEASSHVYDGWESNPPHKIEIYKQLLVDAFTGEGSECDNITSQPAEAEIAMQMYQAAINGEICVIDEHLGEIKLKDCRFPSNHLRLDECGILNKAILDMDGDGVNEYVIQSEAKDHIVLHYYDGKVYSYCFDSKSFFNLNTDGSFYWIDSYDLSNCTRGHNQILFDGSLCHVKEIYRIKQTSPYDYGDGDHEYYMDGKQITHEKFRDYYDSNCRGKTMAIFSPLDISCEYPISSEKAFELASVFWGFKSGKEDGAAGSLYVLKIVILEKPNSNTQSYRIGYQWEHYSTHVIDSCYAQPPSSVRIYEELIVDAITGEVREYDNITSQPSKNEIAMEMYAQTLNGLASYTTPYSGIPLCECENLGYTYVDLDGDSINELIIDCGDTLILRYYEGTVYFYEFTFRSLYYLKTDGSYSWNHTGSDFEYGENQIYFEGAALKTREIWRIINDGEPDAEYYIGDKMVTQEEILKYFEDNPKTKIKFSPLEVSWVNKISQADAVLLAQAYWNPFGDEGEKGYIIVPGYNENAPLFVYVILKKHYVEDHWSVIDEIWIHKNTGEAIIPYAPDGKG